MSDFHESRKGIASIDSDGEMSETERQEGNEVSETENHEGREMPETETQEGTSSNPPAPPTIFRVPPHMKRGRESEFAPKLVSIGPYFHGLQNLNEMEQRKPQFAMDLQRHLAINRNIIEALVDAFSSMEPKIRNCYTDINSINPDVNSRLLKVLAVDCCFIIQLLNMLIPDLFEKKKDTVDYLGFDMKEIRSDLLLLENQIPLFILRSAHDLISSLSPTSILLPTFKELLQQFIRIDKPWYPNETNISVEAYHLLDLYWRCCSPNEHPLDQATRFLSGDTSFKLPSQAEAVIQAPNNAKTKRGHNTRPEGVKENWIRQRKNSKSYHVQPRNATFLRQTAGIGFKNLLLSIGFEIKFENGIMQMPCLKISPIERKLLLNLIAYEHFMHYQYRICMSYVQLMDSLIDTEEDVALLQTQGVLNNRLMNNSEAANFFNDIGNLCSVNHQDNFFRFLIEDMNIYCESKVNQQLADLHRNYFSSPWATISVVAGSALLLMTFLQTFYTVYGYYHPKH